MSLRETQITETKEGETLRKSESFDPVKQDSRDALSQQGDDPDRPKKVSELYKEYVALTEDIQAIQTRIHELSKSSGIDFLSEAQRHLQAIDAVDHTEVWDTANKTFRADEPSEEQRAKNKKLLDEYVINAKKRKDFLVDYQKVIVGFRESVEKTATELVRDISSRVEILDVDLGKKKREIKDILTAADETMKDIDYYRGAYIDEIMQVERYFNICVGKLQDCISKVKESNDGVSLEELNNLKNSTTEAKKALSLIDFRDQYPTARDILNAYSPPEYLLEWHAKFSLQCWEKISRRRAIEEFGHEIEDKEFKKYYKDYLEKLDKHAIDLVEPEDTQIWICRWPHKLLEILECGRIKSMFETQTAGGEEIGSKRQAEIEAALYGFPPDYSDEVRPLYTSVTKGSYALNPATRGFGAAAIKLKPSVQQRATKIMYDSGCLVGIDSRFLTARPVPFNEPGRNCFSLTDPFADLFGKNLTLDERTKIATTLREKDPLKFKTANDIKPWLEGQIHGGLTIDDIEEIHFTERIDFELKRELNKKVSNEQKEDLRSLLSDAGKHEVENIVENIKKEGLATIIKNILREQISDQIRIKLNKMYYERLEYLERSTKEQKETLKKLLEERGIAYRFDSPYIDLAFGQVQLP